jgi:hypothetical protein
MTVVLGLAFLLVKPQLTDALHPHSGALPLIGVVRAAEAPPVHDPLALIAAEDPLALLRIARQRCERDVRDYRCTLWRQERAGERLGPRQRIEMRFRAEPRSIYLNWLENADEARRAVFVKGRNRNAAGQELAVIEPAGCVLRLFVSEVTIPVDGQRARRRSRQTLDQAGYPGTFAAIEAVNRLARERGELDVRFAGFGVIDGRPTYVLKRCLPVGGSAPGRAYPSALLVVHLDQEWLLPVGVYAYADQGANALLGGYTMTDVEINVDLDDVAFELWPHAR